MSDTPETDAAEMPIDRVDTVPSRPCCIVNADFARKLERERDEALQKLNSHAPDGHNASNWQFFRVREERDEAREISQKYEDRYFSAIIERDEARQQEQIHHDNTLAMQKERDQWRECAEGLAFIVKNSAADYSILRDREAALAGFERLKEANK